MFPVQRLHVEDIFSNVKLSATLNKAKTMEIKRDSGA